MELVPYVKLHYKMSPTPVNTSLNSKWEERHCRETNPLGLEPKTSEIKKKMFLKYFSGSEIEAGEALHSAICINANFTQIN